MFINKLNTNLNNISTFLNFAKKKGSVYLGIKSIIRNKNKIKLILLIKKEEYNLNLIKDLEYLNKNYNSQVYEIDIKQIENTSFINNQNINCIGLTDLELSRAIINKLS